MSVVSRGAGLEVASGRVAAPPPCVWSGGAKWGQSRLCVCVCVCVEGEAIELVSVVLEYYDDIRFNSKIVLT